MENKQESRVSNRQAEAAIKEYMKEQTVENLTKVVNLLRTSGLIVPALVNEDKKPLPLFLSNKNGEQFLAVFTGKEHAPDDMKETPAMVMPFPMCNSIVMQESFHLAGMVINPYTDNLILSPTLVKRLHEADKQLEQQKKLAGMPPAQYKQLVRNQVEYGVLPKRFFAEGEEFVNRLCRDKEAMIYKIFEEVCIPGKGNPFTESDFEVMALNISEDMQLIRVDFPGKGTAPFCFRVYLTFNPVTKRSGYYVIEKHTSIRGRRLGEITPDGKHTDLEEAPVEGLELQRIMELTQENEITLE